MRVAGFDLDEEQRTGRPQRLQEAVDTAGDESLGASEDEQPEVLDWNWDESTSYTRKSTKFVLSRLLLPASYITGAGLVLALLGWNYTWMLTLYVFLAIGLVLVQALMRIPSNDFRDLYFASVFILLSIPLFQAPFLRMDPYGFFTIGNLTNTPVPYLLALLVNLIMALVAGLLFDLLQRWRYSTHRDGEKQPFRRVAWGTVPPLLFVFVCGLGISSIGVLIYLLSMLPVLAGVLTALLVLREQNATLSDRDRKILLWAGAALTVILVSLNGAAIVAGHLLPGLLSLPEGGLFNSWNIDYSALEYPPRELGDRLRLGALWTSLASLAYMVVAVAVYLVSSVSLRSNEALRIPAVAVSGSLILSIGIGGLVLSGSSLVTSPPPDFHAQAEDVWLVPSAVSVEDSAEIKARFRNRSSLRGPHRGVATFDLSIVVQPPTGPEVRHQVDNQPFSYNQDWILTTEHVFDQVGTYTIHAETYSVHGREKGMECLPSV